MFFRLTSLPELQHLTPADRRAVVDASVPSFTLIRLWVRALAGGVAAAIVTMIVLGPHGLGGGFSLGLTLLIAFVAGSLFVHWLILRRIRAALRRYLKQHRQTQRLPMCLNCGYNIEGVAGDTCPECGAAIAPCTPNVADSIPPTGLRDGADCQVTIDPVRASRWMPQHFLVQAWLVMALLLGLPPLLSLLDRETLRRTTVGDIAPTTMRVIVFAQGMLGIAVLAAVVWSTFRQRVHLSLLIVALAATAHATIVGGWLLTVVSPRTTAMYIPAVLPMIVFAALTIGTWVCWRRKDHA